MATSEPATILVVEDDPGVATLQQRRLERAGYRTVVVASAEAALEAAQRTTFDLILLDYRLPGGVTGIDLYKQLKLSGRDVPVIMVTGFNDEATIIRAMRLGVRDFVTKSPEYLDYLPEAVAQVLRQVRLERELSEKQEQLRQAQKLEALGALAGGVAHEFNNLLQIIAGFCEVVQEEFPPSHQAYDDLAQVLNACGRAASLTRYLLTFSRRQELKKEYLNLNAQIADQVKILRRLIGESIEIRLQLSDDVGMLYADAPSIQQMLMNLCINARDAMPSGGRLTISTESITYDEILGEAPPRSPSGRYMRLRVADTGQGMSPEIKRHVFEPFFTTKEVGKGTGLGLAMVYGVVQQHGGAIHVESELGEGTIFTIDLPVVDETVAARAVKAAGAPGGAEKVLIADDTPQVRNLMTRILEGAGYQVVAAMDGVEAVEKFTAEADQFDAVILDVCMPRMSGREACESIRRLRSNVAILFCTGYDSSSGLAEFAPEQGFPLLEKPFHPNDLLRTLRETLDRTSSITAAAPPT